MKSTPKVFVLTLLFWWSIVTPSKAGNPMGIVDGVAQVLIFIALASSVVLLIPIVTAIVGIQKNNRKLKAFSKAYSFVVLGIIATNAVYNDLKPWLFHLIIFLIAALPLVILEARKKQR
ncbi:hypothetical protein [Microscilla marina]|uniref:Uncharacterized protein n=1 Tax=Microscilla marina ATCC 23134 TaxID=313606 RepID=A1ZQ58_MICM2|nr:hypothetical protein [Microscilla marina]EAY27467.1 hypothetical protein M23134_06868 [Microscilla marina ATCC 23134]